MAKIFLLAIAFWLLITILKRYRNSWNAPDEPLKKSEQTELMVQCAHCGVHLPKSDSLLVNDQYYCCQAHADEAGQ
ncbi:MAG: hypothetical protein HOP04_09905 [Methylophilaceae bacterium]|nr:hypothetical protein [Methylophilaceae bacterium]